MLYYYYILLLFLYIIYIIIIIIIIIFPHRAVFLKIFFLGRGSGLAGPQPEPSARGAVFLEERSW